MGYLVADRTPRPGNPPADQRALSRTLPSSPGLMHCLLQLRRVRWGREVGPGLDWQRRG